jgi:hypothetical protein
MTAPSIRVMRESDSRAVADLATQLGYPSSEKQIRVRLAGC